MIPIELRAGLAGYQVVHGTQKCRQFVDNALLSAADEDVVEACYCLAAHVNGLGFQSALRVAAAIGWAIVAETAAD